MRKLGNWHRRSTGFYVRKRGSIYDQVVRRGNSWYINVGMHNGTKPYQTRLEATSDLDNWIRSQAERNNSDSQPQPNSDRHECDGCSGDGLWKKGPIVNGIPTHTGKCFRCGGKGHQTDEDRKRNSNYDNYVRRIPA